MPLPPLLHAPLSELGAEQKALWPSHERAIKHAAAPEAGPAGGTASQNASGPTSSIPSMHCSLSAVSPFTLAASFKFPADCYADHQVAKARRWNENVGKITCPQAMSPSVQSFI